MLLLHGCTESPLPRPEALATIADPTGAVDDDFWMDAEEDMPEAGLSKSVLSTDTDFSPAVDPSTGLQIKQTPGGEVTLRKTSSTIPSMLK